MDVWSASNEAWACRSCQVTCSTWGSSSGEPSEDARYRSMVAPAASHSTNRLTRWNGVSPARSTRSRMVRPAGQPARISSAVKGVGARPGARTWGSGAWSVIAPPPVQVPPLTPGCDEVRHRPEGLDEEGEGPGGLGAAHPGGRTPHEVEQSGRCERALRRTRDIDGSLLERAELGPRLLRHSPIQPAGCRSCSVDSSRPALEGSHSAHRPVRRLWRLQCPSPIPCRPGPDC